jgi:S-formylglutathione hydrolase FrmB
VRLRIAAVALLVLAPAGCGGGVKTGQGTAHGARVVRYELHSRLVGETLPQVAIRPGVGSRRPPLLVFLHGRGNDGQESNANGAFMQALARLGRRAPAVVFPSGGEGSYWHDRRDGRWGDYVVREVIPAAARRLHADRRRVAIGGISMGGFGAYDVARLHPGRFCAVGGHSAAIWRTGGETAPGAFDDAEDFVRHDVVGAARARGRGLYPRAALWLDTGREDPFAPGDRALAGALRIPLHRGSGGHESGYWHSHYGAYLRFYARALARC